VIESTEATPKKAKNLAKETKNEPISAKRESQNVFIDSEEPKKQKSGNPNLF
jgi:hypothetical protein